MSDDVVIIGLKDLGDTLQLLENAVEKRIIRRAMRKGTEIIKNEAIERVPKGGWSIGVDAGDLASKITTKEVQGKDGSFVEIIGVKYEGIKAKSSRRKRALRITAHGNFGNWINQFGNWASQEMKSPSSEDPAVYAKFVEFGRPGKSGHTHQTPRPFMRPAFDSKNDEAQRVIGEEIMSGIKSEIGK